MFSRSVFFRTFIVFLLGYAQCRTQPLPALSGKLTLSGDWKPVVYLVQPRQFGEIATGYSGAVIDSAAVGADGRFVFDKISLPAISGLYQLCVQRRGNRFPNQLSDDNPLLANYMPVVLEKGQPVHCTATAADFQASFDIEQASPENRALLQLRTVRHRAYARDSAALNTHPDEDNLLEHETSLQRFRAPLMAFADTSSVFWPALLAARWVSPAGDYERVPEFLFRLCEKWRAQRPADPWSEQLCKAGSRDRLPILVGDVIPDYPMPMQNGDTTRLHALLGSQLTILDIWASWCMPCRRENRDRLLPLWRQYAGHGLQIVGYSIDSSPESWRAAIVKDGAVWPHASHLSGDATPLLETLHLRTIPANLLLDARGKIIAKNLHGEALQTFVADYFQKNRH